jgi:hypothetical protein
MLYEQTLFGLDGANPLGFLAALGTLRILSLAEQGPMPLLSWRVSEGAWRPSLHGSSSSTREHLVERIVAACELYTCTVAFDLGDDLAVDPEAYRRYSLAAAESAAGGEPLHAEFAACFASESLTTEEGSVQDTALRTMSGAGHQHFLKTMRNLVAETRAEHIYKTLFSRWQYDDPVRNMTLRWDPNDDSRYALRWSDPSGDPERARGGAMWGASRLAIEGLPLLPVMPGGRQLETTGFRTGGSKGTFLTWPLWTPPIALDTLRSLLALRELQHDSPDRVELAQRGIDEVFRSQRLTTGKFRNFTRGVPALFRPT